MQNAMLIANCYVSIIQLRKTIMSFKINTQRKETENKTIRFPIPLIEDIEKVIQGKSITFSGFVIQACQYALENLDSEEKTDE